MNIHEIKLNIEFCDAVLNGEKTFEIRLNDRGYQKGDRVRFIPVSGGGMFSEEHPISDCEYEITYVINGWGLENGYVAFSIMNITGREELPY